MTARFLAAGDTALVVEFGDRVDRELSDRVLRLSALVRATSPPGVVATVPTTRSLLVHYDPLVTDNATLTRAIGKLVDQSANVTRQARLWRIPACYATRHAPDLAEVARRTGLDEKEVVRLHTQTCFHVYMIGFAQGFPYMGDLAPSLVLPRQEDPRVKVPAGSIAIAAGMTAIYPAESPGGWHLIGATPIRLFESRLPQPALLSPGDKVQFEPIDVSAFDAIRARVAADAFSLTGETIVA
jgi:inhibitor of KinA